MNAERYKAKQRAAVSNTPAGRVERRRYLRGCKRRRRAFRRVRSGRGAA